MQVPVNDKYIKFSPEDISAILIGKMKEIAELYFNKKVTEAVIAVPAYFDVSFTRCNLIQTFTHII